MFALSREEWEESPAFDALVQDRLNRQQEREQAFLSHEGDCFAIYQVSREDPQNVRFMNLDWLKSHDIPVDRGNYDLIYTAPLGGSGTKMEQLEKLYEQFNLQKPVDFHSPSMSVSDIVAVKRDGMVSCHYCNSVGFTEIPGFLPDNPLKNAEMSMEDDYGMFPRPQWRGLRPQKYTVPPNPFSEQWTSGNHSESAEKSGLTILSTR